MSRDVDILVQIVGRVLGIAESEITDSLTREESQAWDSFNHLMLMLEVERDVGVDLTAAEIEAIGGFADLRDLVLQKRSEEH